MKGCLDSRCSWKCASTHRTRSPQQCLCLALVSQRQRVAKSQIFLQCKSDLQRPNIEPPLQVGGLVRLISDSRQSSRCAFRGGCCPRATIYRRNHSVLCLSSDSFYEWAEKICHSFIWDGGRIKCLYPSHSRNCNQC